MFFKILSIVVDFIASICVTGIVYQMAGIANSHDMFVPYLVVAGYTLGHMMVRVYKDIKSLVGGNGNTQQT